MATIVTYRDDQPPLNNFPERIISPTRSGPCCFSAMEDLGVICHQGQWEYAYRRCRTCGFTVRGIVRYVLDEEEIANLQESIATVLSE
ncbi:MAG TPA: hypothetical protein VLT62_12220 [Candidatus Methylomirabilis sp.]|nr:hypothetical protein [Candidatus Methylomirabilis sp.]